MKSLGEILKSARQEKKLSSKDISQVTRIEVKYIKALENNNFEKLPSPTFTKGFIRNYALQLNLSPEELIAIYRRDYHFSDEQKPSDQKQTLSTKLSFLSPTGWKLIIAGVTIFLGYLAFQYRALVISPPLSISQPEKNVVITSPVTIEGRTTPDSSVVINQNTRLNPDPSGVFFTQLNFSPGDYQVEVKSTNRFSRTRKKIIPITVVSSP